MSGTLMKFILGVDTLSFEAGADYPARRTTEFFEAQDRTAAGTLKVESLGPNMTTRVLNWTLMSAVDYFALVDWYINKSLGGRKAFTFIDEYGFEGDVKITSGRIQFDEVSHRNFAGTITLEYE